MKFLFLFLCITTILLAEDLNVTVDENRFFGNQGSTNFEVNYSIPYNKLQFYKSKEGFTAELVVDLSLESAGKQVYHKNFLNRIILTNQEKTVSEEEFLDKISLGLTKSDFLIKLSFTDSLQQKSMFWSDTLSLIKPNSMISDMEFSKNVLQDTTDFMRKFHRDDNLFIVKPNHIFSKLNTENIFVYYELENFMMENESCNLIEKVRIKKDKQIIMETEEKISDNFPQLSRIFSLEILDLEDGYYDFEIEIIDNLSKMKNTKRDFFVIKKNKTNFPRLFSSMEDDIVLLKYFLNSKQKSIFNNLNEDGKSGFIERFWLSNDPDPSTKQNELIEDIRKRILYSNLNFTHFDDGWKTDRGRIYIRFGEPDEMDKYTTERASVFDNYEDMEFGKEEYLYDTGSDSHIPSPEDYIKSGNQKNEPIIKSRFAEKEYFIWKYRKKTDLTFIFLDVSATGQFRLIYSDDDREPAMVNWKSMLGKSFDDSMLE